MTSLRPRVLDALQRRNYSPATTRVYILPIKQLADYFGKSPEQLGGNETVSGPSDKQISLTNASDSDGSRPASFENAPVTVIKGQNV